MWHIRTPMTWSLLHPLASPLSNSSDSHFTWLEWWEIGSLMPKLFYTFVNGVLQNTFPPNTLTLTPIFWKLLFISQALTHACPSLWNIPWPTPSKLNCVTHWSVVNKHALGIFHVSNKMPGAGDTAVNQTDPDAALTELTVQCRRKTSNPYEMCWLLCEVH